MHQGQVRYLRETTARKTRINILVPANRWGKSSLVACLQIWFLYYKFGIPPGDRAAWLKSEYRTANIAPHSAQTEAVFKAIHQILTSTYSIKTNDGRVVTNKCHIEWFYLRGRTLNTPPYKQYFHNNSYIEHRSLGSDQGDSLQGKPYGLITYDEGGRSLHLKDEVMGNIIPRLGDWVAPFHLLSTPDQNSPSILYHYELYKNGMAGIKQTYAQEGALSENLLFGANQIKEQYDLFQDDPMAPQVLEGKFIFGGDNLFNIESILEAETDGLNDGKRAEKDHKYVIGTDTAMGSDEMVHSVLDITDLRIVREAGGALKIEGEAQLVKQLAAKGNSKSPQRHLNDFCDLFDAYTVDGKRPNHLLETWNGESARFYQDLPMYIQIMTKCYGSWQPEKRQTDNQNQARPKNQAIKKADIIVALQKLLSARAIKIFKNDSNRHSDGADLSQQLSIYKEDDSSIPTDRVLSLALAAWIAIETASVPTTLEWITL